MNKAELIDAVASKTGETRALSQKMVDAMLEAIVEEVRKGTRVSINRFGSFTLRQRKERTIRNPSTKALVVVKACSVVAFTPSDSLRGECRGG